VATSWVELAGCASVTGEDWASGVVLGTVGAATGEVGSALMMEVARVVG
jgi:hypothetical protein